MVLLTEETFELITDRFGLKAMIKTLVDLQRVLVDYYKGNGYDVDDLFELARINDYEFKKYDVRLFFELKEVNEAVILGMSKIHTENSLIIQHFKNKKICPRQRTLMLLNSLKP